MKCRLGILAVALSLSAIGCGPKPPAAGVAPQAPAARDGGPVAAVGPGAAAQKDPDEAAKDAVRAWLKENLDDPDDLQEVKWWPVVDQTAEFKTLSEEYAAWRKGNPGIQNDVPPRIEAFYSLERMKETYPETTLNHAEKVVRLKFRTKIAGAKTLKDSVFVISDGKARPIVHKDFLFPGTYEKLDTTINEVFDLTP